MAFDPNKHFLLNLIGTLWASLGLGSAVVAQVRGNDELFIIGIIMVGVPLTVAQVMILFAHFGYLAIKLKLVSESKDLRLIEIVLAASPAIAITAYVYWHVWSFNVGALEMGFCQGIFMTVFGVAFVSVGVMLIAYRLLGKKNPFES